MMEKIGGRKMAMTLLVIAVGAIVDVLAPNGLSANLAGLLAAAAAIFGASNAAISVAGIKAGSSEALVAQTKEDNVTQSINGDNQPPETLLYDIDYVVKVHANKMDNIETDIENLKAQMAAATRVLTAVVQGKTASGKQES